MRSVSYGLAEWRGGLQGAAAMLPFTLSYGFIAFGIVGPAATTMGLAASIFSVVFGGLAMAMVSRLSLPAVSPSASSCLIVAAAVAAWLQDPALRPGAGAAGDAAAAAALVGLWALTGLTVLMAGVLQVVLGALRFGSLVRFVPQPVLAGFMNGVAILIALSQLAPALGLSPQLLAREGLAALAGWQPAALAVTAGTALLVVVIGRLAPRWPATLVALLLAGVAVWLLDAVSGAATPGGSLGLTMIGPQQAALVPPTALAPLFGDAGAGLLERNAGTVLATALLLALVGALETVLNLAAIDQAAGTRSDPDRTLASVGAVNIMLGPFGALPVVYMRLRALSTRAGGGRTAGSLVLGSLMLGAVFAFGLPLVEHCPKPVLAGLLLMMAWSLVDRWSLSLLRGRAEPADAGSVTDRRLSLAVVIAVCGVTVLWGFVAGVALGVLLSFVILVRALNRSLVRSRYTAAAIPSRRVYAPAQEQVLHAARPGIAVLELEGALFFGNVERLELEVAALVRESERAAPLRALVLDLRRVSTVDASGAVTLARLRDLLAARGVALHLAGASADNRHGESLRAHGMLEGSDPAQRGFALHDDADRAIEASEQAALVAAGLPPMGTNVPLAQCELFEGLDAAELASVQAHLPERELARGERLFAQGDPGDTLYVLCAGSISVVDTARRQRFVSFSPGMTFGELAVLDGGGRTADAVADEPSRVRLLSAAVLQQLERETPGVAARLYRNLARHLAVRLREASAAWRRAAG